MFLASGQKLRASGLCSQNERRVARLSAVLQCVDSVDGSVVIIFR